MRKKVSLLILGACILSTSYLYAAPKKQVKPLEIGRYEVISLGPQSGLVKVDTVTGKTWMLQKKADGVSWIEIKQP